MRPRFEMLVLALGGLVPAGGALGAQAAAAINPDCEKLLPAALVAKTTGRAGIKLIARDPMVGAGGDCNYAIGGKTMVLLVNITRFAGPQDFRRYKNDRMYQTNQKPVTQVGDEAFVGSDAVVARKGKTLVILSAFTEIDPATATMKARYLSEAQLIDLATQMLARS